MADTASAIKSSKYRLSGAFIAFSPQSSPHSDSKQCHCPRLVTCWYGHLHLSCLKSVFWWLQYLDVDRGENCQSLTMFKLLTFGLGILPKTLAFNMVK